MNIKALALVIVLALVSACDQAIEPTGRPRITENMVAKVVCANQVGSGVQINSHNIITAEHVIRDGACSVSYNRRSVARNLTVVNSTSRDDFAQLSSEYNLRGTNLRLSCEGIVTGQTYWLAGYPGGGRLRAIELVATSKYIRGVTQGSRYSIEHLRVMDGLVQGGMSGGPVFNQSGEVVAIISAISITGNHETMVKELSDTWMC